MTAGTPTDPYGEDAETRRLYLGDGTTGDATAQGRFAESRPRPYMLTGGRARPIDSSLEFEAQVVTTRVGRTALLRHTFEHRQILTLCAQPLSVAEVAARLGLHLGVARVLVADLVALGELSLRRPQADTHRSVEVIERVIRGLESIS